MQSAVVIKVVVLISRAEILKTNTGISAEILAETRFLRLELQEMNYNYPRLGSLLGVLRALLPAPPAALTALTAPVATARPSAASGKRKTSCSCSAIKKKVRGYSSRFITIEEDNNNNLSVLFSPLESKDNNDK
ncbi:uncharacterized protein RSE6_15109 [Rhynchosporium secalis]|uniref:Uncharacterized protein n=1 Tax=Rhynchosporium secalis TaxID=38038 RepID=A0A1E1MWP6_RHYSE|nr:uncharacterized protein RSE6_15109 [Rhynchosporium secalis]